MRRRFFFLVPISATPTTDQTRPVANEDQASLLRGRLVRRGYLVDGCRKGSTRVNFGETPCCRS